MDFVKVKTRSVTRGKIEVYPEYIVCRFKDLLIRGGRFYAIWDPEANNKRGMWSTDEIRAQELIDDQVDEYVKKEYGGATFGFSGNDAVDLTIKYARDFSTNSWVNFKKFCQNLVDTNITLDTRLTFKSDMTVKEDYVSKRLPYDIREMDIPAYNELISTLYDDVEREKIEWAIGAILAGKAKNIQKFLVLYGDAGAGKSTVLNIIERLFDGYYTSFDARALGSANNQFATDVFRDNPLVAIQHDGDLSKIEDNTRINSIVSHEKMAMNEKYKSSYNMAVDSFLFMATNKPVKITDAKSGIIRRLIDVVPSGRRLSPNRYFTVIGQLDEEIPGIAEHCLRVFLDIGDNGYSDYVPYRMIAATDYFFNFMDAKRDFFQDPDKLYTLESMYEIYKMYCDEAAIDNKIPRHKFREELKQYFTGYWPVKRVDDKTYRHVYTGLRPDKLDPEIRGVIRTTFTRPTISLSLSDRVSILDKVLEDCPAQYANTETEAPLAKWDDVTTTLKDLDTSKLHYVRPMDEHHIVADFDLRDENGKKDSERNLAAASEWPPTYAEFSKGGGVHLHYIYTGDVDRLARLYDEGIELKVFTGKSSLRRRLTKCNNLPIREISSGLPMRKARNMLNVEATKDEQHLSAKIEKACRREIFPNTKPSIDYIHKVLEDAYNAGLKYDVTGLRQKVLTFAMESTNQSLYCIRLVNNMRWKSEEANEPLEVSTPGGYEERRRAFFDVEVFPNLLLICWKYAGENQKVVRMYNPDPSDVKELFKLNLIGFNNLRYDNFIVYAAGVLAYTPSDIYQLSQKLISNSRNIGMQDAKNLSYTDVYDFCMTKQSLKKWELELGLPHMESDEPWDQPLDQSKWQAVGDYCENDVLATEAVFNHNQADFMAREILAEVAGMTPNTPTNTLTARIIFGKNWKPQSQFKYTNLSEMFPGYTFDRGKSIYRGEEIGEGGLVRAVPGMYMRVALLDVASMHPTSIETLNLFGEEYTKRFSDIKNARIAIKHKDFEHAKTMLNGALEKYLNPDKADALSDALKIAINSVYGMTSAKFENAFRDPRNIDNIVAKRGALFMLDLKYAVEEQGFTVAHIKTDSIKIPEATPEIIQFVMDFGKKYGYDFEHEATYERMCLVNDAVYIAKYDDKGIRTKGGKKAGQWTSTGAQFSHPIVFKTLFSGEAIEFKDYFEARTVTTALYLDLNESLPDVGIYEKELTSRRSTAERKPRLNQALSGYSDEDLISKIAEGHRYQFIGKAGLFVPIKPGRGGGIMLRKNGDKFDSAPNSKGYRWLEAEMIKTLSRQDDLDIGFHRDLINAAIENISQYGDFEWFRSSDTNLENGTRIDKILFPDKDLTPPWEDDQKSTKAIA